MRKHHLLALAGIITFAVVMVACGHYFDIPSQWQFMADIGAATAADIKKLTEDLAEATKKFNAKSDELSKKAEEAMAEVKNKGQLLAETKKQCDELLTQHTVIAGEKNKIQSQLIETTARIAGLEQELAKRPGTPESARGKTVGSQLVADKDFKAWAPVGAKGSRNSRHRFEVKAATTSLDFPVSEPSINRPEIVPGTLPTLKQRLFVRDLIPVGQTDSPAIFWVKMTGFTNNAEVVSEGTRKPESTISYDGQMTPVVTIAHIFKASKQILADFKQLRSDVDQEMRYGLKYAEEQEVLFGDGSGIHLHGIVPQASAYDPAFEAAMHTRIDDIRLAMLQSQLARLPATGIVMHFVDWAHIELTKDANGQYLFANPLRLAGNTLWGLPVVPTEINDFESHFLVGAFASGAQIYDREEMAVEIATENEDDFVKNMVTIRCEERVGLAVKRPEAFVWGAFAAGSGT